MLGHVLGLGTWYSWLGAAEAAAALEAVAALHLAPAERVEPIIHLLGRLCAMLTRLAGVTR